MLNVAKISTHLRQGLWGEAAHTAQDLDNILVSGGRDSATHNLFAQTESKGLWNHHAFGEMGIVAYHHNNKTRSKLADHGRPCIYLGKSPDHATEVYGFLNTLTK